MYKLKSGIEIERIGDEIIIIDSSNGRFLELNQIGLIIIEKLTEGFSVQKIAEELASAFSMSFSEAADIIVVFVDRLKKLEILSEDV